MLQGKCAVITGASRGIGREIALKYAKEGANIVLNYRNSETEALQLKEELDKLGSDTLIFKANVSNFEEAEKLIKEAKEAFGRVDILVNNAGITKDNLIIRMKEEDFDSVIDVNLKGAFNCLKAVTPIMIRQKSGKIINMSSVVGVIGNAGQVNYCASKAGLIGMTKSLAREIGGKNINVNAIAPGFIDTDMTKVLSEDQKKNIMSQVPLKRLGQAEDIANLALFLGSDQSNYITGQVIHVDGGMAM
ncbi:3-oxoacyl-[acyl-carrier-protein] reductase [Terrisporobacter mayombei]|uniref:3-oxoacyl-[acyl-carrier-protein] reductase n=1 Tax=Terrisporobacter mayombei TaxID=1541 RepID=A0ABY9Q7I0_9FIRM|nr:3-oxoacyl-[acyl-carrier-protein] reductase [Terrisporobacter mayombei]MCC3868848.1 3-oxoacyl-[acyl-carrier-protein] reductase [Terrisporobacter mayombei]WMT83020.1 3-oxoacyl-[acyl-carrier-protein] reductase FabG [Terrisporobacter mayombei]